MLLCKGEGDCSCLLYTSSHAYWSYLAPGVAVKPEQVERTGYAARIISEEIGKGNLPADAVNY